MCDRRTFVDVVFFLYIRCVPKKEMLNNSNRIPLNVINCDHAFIYNFIAPFKTAVIRTVENNSGEATNVSRQRRPNTINFYLLRQQHHLCDCVRYGPVVENHTHASDSILHSTDRSLSQYRFDFADTTMWSVKIVIISSC